MRFSLPGCFISALGVTIAFGQSTVAQSTTIDLANGETAQDLQEIVQTLTSVGYIRKVSVDPTRTAVVVDGTTDQIALAKWLISQLDLPATGPVLANSAEREYKVQGGADDVIRVFYLANSGTQQDLQSVMTSIRAIEDGIRSLFPYSGRRVLTLRGTAAQISLAAWLVNELDKPSIGPLPMNSSEHEYKLQGGGEDVVRVFYLLHSETQQNLEEVMTLIRTMGNTRRLFPYPSRRALTVRGTAAQISLAAWLVNELDKPARAQSSAPTGPVEYLMPGESDGVVRLFYFPNSLTPQELNDIMVAVHSATNARSLFPMSAQKVLVVRGTASQIAIAERVINDRR
jgi:type II secretory pathway component GspD/PulD (secretin)